MYSNLISLNLVQNKLEFVWVRFFGFLIKLFNFILKVSLFSRYNCADASLRV